jgi:hypothetical protein
MVYKRTFGEIGTTSNNQKIKGKLDNRGYPCMFIGYTEDHASNVYVLFNLNNQAIFMSRNVVWLNKLFHQHMKTKSALIPGNSIYDVSPALTNTQPVPAAIAPTFVPAPITPRLTRTTAPRIFTPPSISASDDFDDDGDDVIIQNQVIRVTLHYLHMIIILVKISYLLILTMTPVQILKLLVMISSFVILIYLNMTVIDNLLLKLY